MENSPVFKFLFPFILPIGVFVVSTTIESIMKYGQVLSKRKLKTPKNAVKKIFFHYGKFMHHFYFACFTYDLSALVNIAERMLGSQNVYNPQINHPVNFYIFISVGILLHVLFYFHTYFILREYEQERAKAPITILHTFYISVSIFLLIAIRYSQL